MKNTFYAIILLAGICFGQRQYTVAAIPSPTSDTNFVTWVSDDGSTTFGVLLYNGGAISSCYSVKNGQFTMYPTPGLSCFVRAVNANLQFTGVLSPIGQTGTPNFAGLSLFVNLNGGFDIFGQQIGATVQSKGFNIHGAVAGTAVDGRGNNFGWVYSGGQVQNLPLNFLTGGGTYPSPINDNGDVAGSASPTAPWSANTCQAAIYRNGSVINIGAPSGGAAYSSAINSSGQVVGSGQTAPISFNHAPDPGALIPVPFFYDGTTMHAIHVPGAAYGGYADVLNDSGEAVGRYYPDNLDGCTAITCNYTHRAFYYYNGTAVDLNSLLVNPPAGLVLRDVYHISNSGFILAGAENADGSWSPTYLLTPVTPSAGAGPSNGSITASPNPAVPAMNGNAITTIFWNAPSGVTAVEVHIGAPTGQLFAIGGPAGSAVTGPWVSDGTTFYLQDASNGAGSNSATLGTVVVTVH